MKQIYKTLILAVLSLWSVVSSAQNEVTYGFIQDANNPRIITAVAYPNFTSSNVTIVTGLFTMLLPAGTITDPAIPPAPDAGSFIDVTGDWTAQLVNAANYSGAGFDPADLMGFDVYQVVLQNSPSPNTVSGQPVQLFRLTLPGDCVGDSVRVLVNDSAIQQAILNNLGANFNNEMSISVNNALSVDLYAGNAPNGSILPCPLDDVPDAVNDTISVNEDSGATNILVLANDDFGNNGPAVGPISVITPSVNGTTMLNQNGTPNDPTDDFLTYTPNANFFGQDSIFYAICDAQGDCDTAQVVITVNAINDGPNAVDDSYMVNEDGTLMNDVTTNDTDVDGPMTNITLVTDVANGTLTLNPDGTFTYVPDANYDGPTDSFTYSYCDGGTPNLCDTAVVTITVNAINDAPDAVNDSYMVNEDGTLMNDVTTNDTDVDGPMTNITLVTDVANGTLTLNADGTFTYVPDANYDGPTDSFTYSYCDGGTPNLCDTATVTITVNAINDAPDAVNDSYMVNEDGTLMNDVTTNDTDVDGPMTNITLVTDVANGTLTLNADGTFTYVPDANYDGPTDSFTYSYCDGGTPNLCDTAVVTITVNAINDAPDAVNDSYMVNEDGTLMNDVTTNDTDVDGPMTNITLVTDVANGTLTLNADGTFTYVPDANYDGPTDSFTYSYCDGGTPNLCDTAVVTITVNAINDAPDAVNDSYTVNEDGTLMNNVTTNDTDVDGPMTNITLVTDVANGTLTLNPDGMFTYTPDPGYNGSDSFSYSYCDGGTPNLCDTATVNITVDAVNDAPMAVDDIYPINEDGTLMNNVTANDTDPDGPMVIVTLVTDVTNGTLVLNPDGSFTYTPDPNYNGSDSFTYSYCDGGTPNQCDTATVTIPIAAVNDAPVANNDNYPINEDGTLMNDVTANDTDVDGPMTNITLVTDVANGTLTLNADGTFTYVPDADYAGPDSFTYSYCDSGTPNLCDTATVTITVNAINDGPNAVDDSYMVNEDGTLMNDVTTNDTDVDGPMTNITLVTDVANGTLTLNADGTFTYVPDANYDGPTDSFTYSYCDGGMPNLCDTAVVTITVNAINDAPDAVNDSYMVNEDGTLMNDVTTNDTDVDGPMTNITLVTDVANGTLTLNPDGTFTYTPDPGYNGSDSFSYSYCDGGTPNLCDTATVNITVDAVNDAPMAVDDTYPINEDGTLMNNVTANDTDPDGPMVIVTLVTDVTNGTLVLNPDGSFTYTPDPNYNGSDSFTYSYCDGGTPNQCDTATVTIPIAAVNDAPVANNDNYPINEDGTLMNDVTTNDTDVDGPMTNITLVTDVTNGTLVLNPDGTFTYTPDPGYNGSDSFTYSFCDGGTPNLCDTATVTIPIAAVNDAPMAVDDTFPTDEDMPLMGDVSLNDSDPDGPMENITVATPPMNGTLILNPDGTFTYTPDPNTNGPDSFTYSYCDGGTPNQCDTATVVINVNAINDAPMAVDDTYPVDENAMLTGDVTDNDTDVDGPMTNVTLVTDVTNGTLTLNPDGTFSYDPDPNYNGPDSFSYSYCDGGTPNLCDTATVAINVNALYVRLNLRMLLQAALLDVPGPLMDDDLRSEGKLPLTEPYSTQPSFTHVNGGGGEVTTAPVLAVTGDDAIVDWVFIELRSAMNPITVVATRSALLQRDGDVVDVDGTSSLFFGNSLAGDYYVAIRHRNHLGAMTASPITLTTMGTLVDFTLTSIALWDDGMNSDGVEQATIGGRFALWAANTNQNSGTVYSGQNNDKSPIFNKIDSAPGNSLRLQSYVFNGYHAEDVNMSGEAIYSGQNNDPNYIFNIVDSHPKNTLRLQSFVIREQLAK